MTVQITDATPSAANLPTVVGALGAAMIAVWGVLLGATRSRRTAIDAIYSQEALRRRIDTYIGLGEFVVRFRAAALAAPDDAPGAAFERDDENTNEVEKWWHWQASVEVFGSSTARACFESLLTARVRLITASAMWRKVRMETTPPAPDQQDVLAQLRADRSAAITACEEMLSILHGESMRGPYGIKSLSD